MKGELGGVKLQIQSTIIDTIKKKYEESTFNEITNSFNNEDVSVI